MPNSDGGRSNRSKAVSNVQSTGTYIIQIGGSRCARAFTTASDSASSRRRADRVESPAPILVSGKSGQLGRCLFDAASARNIPLILAGRPDFDVTDRASMDRAITDAKPSVIINAAAYTAVDKAEAEPERCYAVNRDGAGQFAEAAWRHTVPFIHVSTDYVFDGQKPSAYYEDD